MIEDKNDMRNNISKTVTLLILLLMVVIPGRAQNRIDRMVEDYSTVGTSSFTSVVERDPNTRQVKKVVKVLTLPGHQTSQFHDAFLKEKATGTFTEQQQSGVQTLTLTCEKPAQTRLYMLRRTSGSGKVTIIVKMKKP